jgi:hypothetical protein
MGRRDLYDSAGDLLRTVGHLAALAALLYLIVYVAARVVTLARAADITFWVGLTLATATYIRLRSRHARSKGRTYVPTGVIAIVGLSLLVAGMFHYTTRPGLSLLLNLTALLVLLTFYIFSPDSAPGSGSTRTRRVRHIRQGPREYDRRGLARRSEDGDEDRDEPRGEDRDTAGPTSPPQRRRRAGGARGRNSTQRPDRTDNADPDLGRP